VLACCIAACTGGEPVNPPAASAKPAAVSEPAGTKPAAAAPTPAADHGTGVVQDLPYAQGRTFDSLDAYLAFLKQRGKTGVPWYREVKPGLYELVSRRGPGAEPRRYTRAELLERFGFTDPPSNR